MRPPAQTSPQFYSTYFFYAIHMPPLAYPHISFPAVREAAPCPLNNTYVPPEEIHVIWLELLSSASLQPSPSKPCCISASQQWTRCCWNIPFHASCWASLNGIRSLLLLRQPFAIRHCWSSALSPLPKPLNKCICSSLIHVSLPPFLYATSCKQTFYMKR